MISTAASETSTSGSSKTSGSSATSLAGKVDKLTQQNYDKYKADYSASQKVNDAYSNLQKTLANKPGAFQSDFKDKLDSLYEQVVNRGEFNFNPDTDPMFKMYRDNYMLKGRNAMQDAQAQAAANTGGFGSSYAQSAGQQMYQSYLDELNDKIPELYQQSYARYRNQGEDLSKRYEVTKGMYDTEYGQYRDTMDDWQADRDYMLDSYQDERNFDYGKFSDNRKYWQDEYWRQKGAVQKTSSSSKTTTSSSSSSSTNNSYA